MVPLSLSGHSPTEAEITLIACVSAGIVSADGAGVAGVLIRSDVRRTLCSRGGMRSRMVNPLPGCLIIRLINSQVCGLRPGPLP